MEVKAQKRSVLTTFAYVENFAMAEQYLGACGGDSCCSNAYQWQYEWADYCCILLLCCMHNH